MTSRPKVKKPNANDLRIERANCGLDTKLNLLQFTRDEAILILSFLDRYDVAAAARAYGDDSFILKPRNLETLAEPLKRYGSANFCQVRYKLEHAVNPKNI